MSWNIDIVGKAADVNAAVQKETSLPQPLKAAVELFATAAKDKAIHVVTAGHYGPTEDWSSVQSFSIKPITLAPPWT